MKMKQHKNDITFQQDTFLTKHAESKNTTQNWFSTTDLAYMSQLKTAQSLLIKLVLPLHVTDHQAPLMMMQQPLLVFYITDCNSLSRP
jgi:hypothetical protein